jgi:hypothetical protein
VSMVVPCQFPDRPLILAYCLGIAAGALHLGDASKVLPPHKVRSSVAAIVSLSIQLSIRVAFFLVNMAACSRGQVAGCLSHITPGPAQPRSLLLWGVEAGVGQLLVHISI